MALLRPKLRVHTSIHPKSRQSPQSPFYRQKLEDKGPRSHIASSSSRSLNANRDNRVLKIILCAELMSCRERLRSGYLPWRYKSQSIYVRGRLVGIFLFGTTWKAGGLLFAIPRNPTLQQLWRSTSPQSDMCQKEVNLCIEKIGTDDESRYYAAVDRSWED